MRTITIPMQIDGRGGIATSTTPRELARQQMRDLLRTNPFERPMDPEYGAGIQDALFVPDDQEVGGALDVFADQILTILRSQANLCNVLGVSAQAGPAGSGEVTFNVNYSLPFVEGVETFQTTVSGLADQEDFT
jgi:phage baseplate assembly protein W